MDFSKTIEDLGKYLNEILGYLLPGLMLNFMCYLIVDSTQIKLLQNAYFLNVWVVIFISYVTGYCIYGAAIFRDTILKGFFKFKRVNKLLTHLKNWKEGKLGFIQLEPYKLTTITKIEKSVEYNISKKGLSILINDQSVESLTFNDVRSLVMSYIPESDQKIYTFMFRSELCNHIGFIFMWLGLWILAAKATHELINNTMLIKTEVLNLIYLPVIFIVLSYFFALARNRFFGIAYKIPFSLFLSKFHKIK